jgi:hypothetical protein
VFIVEYDDGDALAIGSGRMLPNNCLVHIDEILSDRKSRKLKCDEKRNG